MTVESKQIPATIPTRARTLLGASLQRVMPRLPTPKVEPEVSDAKLTAALGSTLRQYGHLLFERNIAAFASHLNDFLHEEEDDEDDDTD